MQLMPTRSEHWSGWCRSECIGPNASTAKSSFGSLHSLNASSCRTWSDQKWQTIIRIHGRKQFLEPSGTTLSQSGGPSRRSRNVAALSSIATYSRYWQWSHHVPDELIYTTASSISERDPLPTLAVDFIDWLAVCEFQVHSDCTHEGSSSTVSTYYHICFSR